MAGVAGAESITICAYGGTYNTGIENIFGKPFTEATGIEVIVTTRPIYSKMEVQVKSGNVEWDIVDAESRMFERRYERPANQASQPRIAQDNAREISELEKYSN